MHRVRRDMHDCSRQRMVGRRFPSMRRDKFVQGISLDRSVIGGFFEKRQSAGKTRYQLANWILATDEHVRHARMAGRMSGRTSPIRGRPRTAMKRRAQSWRLKEVRSRSGRRPQPGRRRAWAVAFPGGSLIPQVPRRIPGHRLALELELFGQSAVEVGHVGGTIEDGDPPRSACRFLS